MDFSIPLSPSSLIRPAPEGVDRDITVTLDGSTHTTMKESQLQRRVGGHEDKNEVAVWVEYRLDGQLVHRSAHVHLKKAVFGEAIADAVLG